MTSMIRRPRPFSTCCPIWAGLRVLDLACGQGRLSRELARRGARVVGLDISNELLDKARAVEKDEPLGISYRWRKRRSYVACRGRAQPPRSGVIRSVLQQELRLQR
jgi:2-polyprenyl-3-methyl-5-hydroxy-6-metoxy-1,4-benzoquinol methylase